MAKRLKWGTIDNLNTLIDQYFTEEHYPSIVGLRLYIDLSDDCWKYYTSDKWKTHRKSDEEIEVINKIQTESIDNEPFEELMEISEKSIVQENEYIENDIIKARLSTTLKKAKDRIEAAINKQILSKSSAGAMFYAKAALGYRETDPGEQQAQLNPTKITINIMPAPDKPAFQQVIDVTPDRKKLE